jgi:WD40 repeat protein
MLRIWDTTIEPTHVQTVWQGVKEKVTALAWHPNQMKLAFGTEHGKVGMWNSLNNKGLGEKFPENVNFVLKILSK